jgi:hypothetical protein
MKDIQLIILLTGLASIIGAIGVIIGKIKTCDTKCSNCVQDTTQHDVEAPKEESAPTLQQIPQIRTTTPQPRVLFPNK